MTKVTRIVWQDNPSDKPWAAQIDDGVTPVSLHRTRDEARQAVGLKPARKASDVTEPH